MAIPPDQPPLNDVLVLDADCGMCSGLAHFIYDRLLEPGSLVFAGQRSELGQAVQVELPPHQRELDTVVLRQAGELYVRSAAIVRLAPYLGWPWRLLFAALWLIPPPLRDLGYRLVAHYRRRLWPPAQSCAVPGLSDAEER
ncbi:MAG: hypothetical protein CMP23_13900 [Rickettsiales bacterium]|nr:hypothetical protein [Rickettsiales bacterium]|tara:strand:+ start:1643 stop:2065 length:423 start_codon:yes stop_codon:yes gene_type:complete